MVKSTTSENFLDLKKQFFDQLTLMHCSVSTLNNYKSVFSMLKDFMEEHGFTDYSSKIGKMFIEEECGKNCHGVRMVRQLKTTVRRVNDLMECRVFHIRMKKNL